MRVVAAVANRLLTRDAWSRQQLAMQAGKVARVRFGSLVGDFRIAPDGQLVSVSAARPDATLTIPLRSILDAPEFPDRAAMTIVVEGDEAVGAVLVGVARVTFWLVESEVARLTGPIAANRLAGAVRVAFRVPRYAAERLRENTRDYFRDEAVTVVRRSELTRHAVAVQALARRLDATLERAAAAASGPIPPG